MKRTQFTFYESFFKAISKIKKKADRADAYDIICKYAMIGETPDEKALSDAVSVVFELCRPVLDSSRKKAENRANKTKNKTEQTDNKQEQTDNKAEEEKNKPTTNGNKTEQTRKEKEGEREKEREYEYIKEMGKEKSAAKKTNGNKREADEPFPPTLETVREHCRKIGSSVNPDRFYRHYSSRGWRLSGGDVAKDWRSILRTWESRESAATAAGNHTRGKSAGIPAAGSFDTDEFFNAALAHTYAESGA